MKKRVSLGLLVLFLLTLFSIPFQAAANGVDYLYTVYVCTTDGFLNMRDGPSTDDDILYELPDCAAVQILNEDGNWGYGHFFYGNNCAAGWIYLPGTKSTYSSARDNAGKATSQVSYISGNGGYMNLRKEPTTEYDNIITTIPNGAQVTVTRRTDRGWGLVAYNGSIGWVSYNGLQAEPLSTQAPVQTVEPIPTPLVQTVSPDFYKEKEQPDKEVGKISIEGEPILGGNALVLIMIGVAIFLVITVAVLMIVVLNRGKNEQKPTPPRAPQTPPAPPQEPFHSQNQNGQYSQSSQSNQNYPYQQ